MLEYRGVLLHYLQLNITLKNNIPIIFAHNNANVTRISNTVKIIGDWTLLTIFDS